MKTGNYWVTYKVIGEGHAEITIKEGEKFSDVINTYFLMNGAEITHKEVFITKVNRN